MKVRNIVFSGFAAAILMGTAQAATTPFEIASKAYVDGKFSTATSAASEVADDVGDMTQLQNGEGSNIDANTDNLVDAINDLDTALNAKQDKSNSQVTNAGNHLTAGYGVGGNLESLDSALGAVETKVGSGTLTSTIGATSVSNIIEAVNALETKTAGQAGSQEVANIQEILNGDPNDDNDDGLVGDVEDLQDIVGDGELSGFGQGIDDLTDAVNDLQANKQDKADSTVADGTYNYITQGNGVAANLVDLDTQLKSTTDTANAAVPRQMNGTNGKALIFNEEDGGGAKFEHNDGTNSFTGVNNDGANGIAAQIYAIDKTSKTGTRIDVSKGAIYYTVGNAAPGARMVPENEIATKGDIAAVNGDMDELNDGANTNFNNPTDVVDALNDLDDAINTKADADDVGNIANLTGFETQPASVVAALNDLQANKLNKPIPNTCSADSRHCVLHMDNTGALSWVDITVPYVDGDTGGGASETPVEP